MVDQTSIKIGRLEATLEGLQELVRQQTTESRESRTRLYAKLEEVSATLQALASRQTDLEDRIKAMEPVIAEAASAKQQAIGAGKLLRFQWAVFGGSIAAGIGAAWTFLAGKHP